MPFQPHKHNRHSIRLRDYDYARAGAYFVTICVQHRQCLFGDIHDGEMRLNTAGKMVADDWQWLASRYDHVELDEWVVMPNHLHGILVLTQVTDSLCRGGSRTAPTAPPKPLGRLIGAFKTVSTKHINELRRTPGGALWQRNYWEHIVRDELDLREIKEYIMNNPMKWQLDQLYPAQPAFVSQ